MIVIAKYTHFALRLLLLVTLLPMSAQAGLSGNADKDAGRLYQLLTGVPLMNENPLKSQIVSLIAQGNVEGAAAVITDPQNGATEFYEVVVRNIASVFGYSESSIEQPLNDFMALFIGIVRDDAPISDLLTANYLYNVAGITPAYANNSNAHYLAAAAKTTYVRSLTKFVPTDFTHVGAYNTRAFGLDYFKGGTKRRNFEALVQKFFNVSQKSVMMADLPEDQYRRDFPMAVGGVPIENVTSPLCIGCHRSMDGAVRTFLGYAWNANTNRLEVAAPGSATFDQVNEVNRAGQLANSTVGKIYVSPEMNDRVFGYSGLMNRGAYLEADIGDMKQFMEQYVTQSRGFYRGMAERVAFYMYTGRILTLVNRSEADAQLLSSLKPIVDELLDGGFIANRNLRKLFEAAAVQYLKS
jgi:hypothetical protein